jgi:hypothetical protein
MSFFTHAMPRASLSPVDALIAHVRCIPVVPTVSTRVVSTRIVNARCNR